MKTLTEFALCWLLMWGIAYIVTAIYAPGIGGDPFLGSMMYSALGGAIIVLVIIRAFKHDPTEFLSYWVRVLLFVVALIEIYGGIASWTGLAVWNVPFTNKELFQISMAFADLVSAVLMLYLALFDYE